MGAAGLTAIRTRSWRHSSASAPSISNTPLTSKARRAKRHQLSAGSWRCRTAPPWLRGHATVSYAEPWSGLLARFKFRGDVGMARNLADLMRDTPGVDTALAAADAVVPVPLSRTALVARGFNQAQLLAAQLAPRKLCTALQRQHFDQAQHTQTRAQRLRRMQQAFSCARPQAVQGLRLLLIDDVMTTGATVSSIANLLLARGASAVDAMVFARTPAPGE